MLSRRSLLLTPLLASCNRTPTHQRVDPALAPLIPADTTALAGVRLDNLKKTPAWAKLFPPNAPTPLDAFSKRTGMDLSKAVYEIVYCLGAKRPLALIRGRFVDGGPNNSGIEPTLKLEGAQKFPYKGFVLQGREEAAVTFINESVAIAGPAASIRSVIDARDLKNTIPTGLLNMVSALPFEAHIYLVSDRPAIPEGGIGGLKSLPIQLKSIQSWIDFQIGAAFHADIEATSEAEAKKLIDSIKGLSGILRMTLKPSQREMLSLLDSLQFYQEATHAKAQAEIPLDLVIDGIKSVDSSSSRVI